MEKSENICVGIEHAFIEDPTRRSVTSAQSRVIPISIFYPSAWSENLQPVSYEDIFRPSIRAAFGYLLRESPLPHDLKEKLIENSLSVSTDCYSGATPLRTSGHYPLILYSPSGDGNRFSNLRLLRALARSGYLVASIDHPHEGNLIVYPDGCLCSDTADDDDFIQLTKDRVIDSRKVLDFLCGTNFRPELANLIDHDAIGMFGHSQGGYVSTLLDAEDERIKAVSNIDGFLYAYWTNDGSSGINNWPSTTQAKLRASRSPFLRIKGRPNLNQIDELFVQESKDFAGEFNFQIIEGWEHQDFSVDRLKTNHEGADHTDTMFAFQPTDRVEYLSNVLIEFFDIYLKKKPHRKLLSKTDQANVKYQKQRDESETNP